MLLFIWFTVCLLNVYLLYLLLLFSRPVLSRSSRPHGLQHSRLPCPSPSPWVCPGSCPLDWWCIEPSHPLMLSSPSGLSLCQHETFPTSWLFSSGDQTTGASASASVLPMIIQGWFPLRLTGLIPFLSKGH